MLYGEFKKQFNKETDNYVSDYKFDDKRNFNSNKPRNKEKSNPKKSKKLLKIIVILILIIITVACATLLYFELFNAQGISAIFSYFSKKTEYIYCLSAGSFDTLEKAITVADNLKSKGCAGYIHYNGAFNVLVSFYLDEKTAMEVQEKSNYTIFKIFVSSPIKDIPSTLKGEYDKCKNFDKELLNSLYEASKLLENNKNLEQATQHVNSCITKAKEQTKDFLSASKNISVLNVQKYSSKINSALQELDNLKSNITLSKIRFSAIFIALVMA